MTAIVKKQISIIGVKLAIHLARKVPNIKVSDDGTVTAGANKEVMKMLVDQYKTIAGGISVMFAKKAIQPLLTGNEDLPDELR